MRISYLETLLMISKVSSFSEAAQVRNMTLSALSMQMKTLEEELNVKLFDRSFRPPKLTPLGHQIAESAQKILEAAEELKSKCSQDGAMVGTFRVGFVPSTAVRILPVFLKEANNKEPLADFKLSSGLSENLCDSVRRGQIDVAVVTEIEDEIYELASIPIVEEEMVIVAPKSYAHKTLRELSKELPFIHFMPRSGIGKLIKKFCLDLDLNPTSPIVLDNIESITSCVRQEVGFSLLPKPDVLHYAKEDVHFFSCAPAPVFRKISLVARQDPLSQMWQTRIAALLKEAAG